MSEQPYPESGGFLRAEASRFVNSLFGLAPDGVFRAASLTLGAVVSYTTFSPLLPNAEVETRNAEKTFRVSRSEFRVGSGLILCGTFRQNVFAFRPRVSLQRGTRNVERGKFQVPPSEFRVRRLRGIVLCGVRTFLLHRVPPKRDGTKAILRSSKIRSNVASADPLGKDRPWCQRSLTLAARSPAFQFCRIFSMRMRRTSSATTTRAGHARTGGRTVLPAAGCGERGKPFCQFL